LEFAMIKSGFYGTVLKTSSAPEFQQAWQEVGVEVHRQLRVRRTCQNQLLNLPVGVLAQAPVPNDQGMM
jgi:hypothetical protein